MATFTNTFTTTGNKSGHHHRKDHHHPIRYFKLQNHGAAVIHSLIKDKNNNETVFDGGPTLANGGESTLDLSQTPPLQDHTPYCFGAFVTAGSNQTDKHHHLTDFSSNLVGIWKWTGTTIAKSKVEFVGYEEYEPKGVVEECIEKLVLVRERLNAGEMKEARKGEVERVVGALGEYVERVLVEHDLETTIPVRARL